MIRFWLIGILVLGAAIQPMAQTTRYTAASGTVTFVSDAPLEYITAASTALRGILDPAQNTFAFTLPVSSFEGFNSPLQQEHFHENYMESAQYPAGQFSGKIIESVTYNVPGTYAVRAKGDLLIHGIAVERIIPVTLVITEETVDASASFMVSLSDHNISIPRIVRRKIAEEIAVAVSVSLTL